VGGEGGGTGCFEDQDREAAGRGGVLGDPHAEGGPVVGDEAAALLRMVGVMTRRISSIRAALRSDCARR
jgi:hypothetical protein